MCATSSTVRDSRRAAPPDSSAIMARSKATAARVFPDCCVCNCLWPGREMTASAPNSGGLDNTRLYNTRQQVLLHLRTARVTRFKNKRPLFSSSLLIFLSEELIANCCPLVSRHRLANFFTLSRRAVSVCRSDRRRDRAQRNESTFIRRRRLLFQDNLPIELRHAGIVGRVVLDLVGLCLAVAGAFLLFARRFRNPQLVK